MSGYITPRILIPFWIFALMSHIYLDNILLAAFCGVMLGANLERLFFGGSNA